MQIYGPSMPIMLDVVNERPLAVNVDGKSKMQPLKSMGKLLSQGFSQNQIKLWFGGAYSSKSS